MLGFLKIICSLNETSAFLQKDEYKYDLFFFLIFLMQTFLLTSLPTGYHSQNTDGWIAFSISLIFCFSFYPLFYYKYYRNKKNFIREIIIMSTVVRFHAFIFSAIIAILALFVIALLKLKRPTYISLAMYVFYYLIFTGLMFRCKKRMMS